MSIPLSGKAFVESGEHKFHHIAAGSGEYGDTTPHPTVRPGYRHNEL
jgi:hypothetical protein